MQIGDTVVEFQDQTRPAALMAALRGCKNSGHRTGVSLCSVPCCALCLAVLSVSLCSVPRCALCLTVLSALLRLSVLLCSVSHCAQCLAVLSALLRLSVLLCSMPRRARCLAVPGVSLTGWLLSHCASLAVLCCAPVSLCLVCF